MEWIIGAVVAVIALIVTYFTGRGRGRAQGAADAVADRSRADAKDVRRRLNGAVERQDDDAVQREAMRGVKPAKGKQP